MEPQTPETAASNRVKPLYWLAAAALTVAIVLDLVKPPIDWLRFAGRVPLVVLLVMLATAKPAETRVKKLIMYALIAISIGLFVAKLARGA